MYKQNRNRWSKHFDFFLLDVVLLEVAFFLCYGFRHDWLFHYNINYYRRIGLFLALVSICTAMVREIYHGIIRRGYLEEFKNVVVHIFVVEGFLIAITFFMKDLYYSREVFLFFLPVGIFICFFGRCIWKCILRRRMVSNRDSRQVLIITSEGQADGILEEITSGEVFDFDIVGLVLTEEVPSQNEIGGYPVLGTVYEKNMPYIHDNVVDEIFIHLKPGEFIEEKYMEQFLQMGLTLHMDLSGFMGVGDFGYVENFAGRSVVTSSMKMASLGQILLKRLMDIAGGVVGLLITGIACIFVIPSLKKADKGPVFFSQTRIGKNGRRFKLYKFRSMYVDAEERKQELMSQNEMQGLMFKMENDPRIIKGIGQFIRETSIDELPQFWNVLKGDMSLVGTRPPTVEEYEMYEMHHLTRMAIKPGITGMWQTSGRNDIKDFEEVVKLDTQYIMNWNITLDIKILFKTIVVVLKKEGSR